MNVDLKHPMELSPWRHLALGTWRTAYDPSIYATMAVRMEAALDYIARFRASTGRHLTVTHLMVRVAGALLAEVPELNAILRWNRLYARASAAVFCQVALEDPESGTIDLSGVKIEEPERKSLVAIVEEFEQKTRSVRRHDDGELERGRRTLTRIPAPILPWVTRVLGFLAYTLNLDLSRFGIAKDPFGSLMITNVGALGLEAAYAPLVPLSRVPVLVTMGRVENSAVVENGAAVPAKVMRLFATLDHRVVDGVHGVRMAALVKRWFEHPFDHFDVIPTASGE